MVAQQFNFTDTDVQNALERGLGSLRSAKLPVVPELSKQMSRQLSQTLGSRGVRLSPQAQTNIKGQIAAMRGKISNQTRTAIRAGSLAASAELAPHFARLGQAAGRRTSDLSSGIAQAPGRLGTLVGKGGLALGRATGEMNKGLTRGLGRGALAAGQGTGSIYKDLGRAGQAAGRATRNLPGNMLKAGNALGQGQKNLTKAGLNAGNALGRGTRNLPGNMLKAGNALGRGQRDLTKNAAMGLGRAGQAAGRATRNLPGNMLKAGNALGQGQKNLTKAGLNAGNALGRGTRNLPGNMLKAGNALGRGQRDLTKNAAMGLGKGAMAAGRGTRDLSKGILNAPKNLTMGAGRALGSGYKNLTRKQKSDAELKKGGDTMDLARAAYGARSHKKVEGRDLLEAAFEVKHAYDTPHKHAAELHHLRHTGQPMTAKQRLAYTLGLRELDKISHGIGKKMKKNIDEGGKWMWFTIIVCGIIAIIVDSIQVVGLLLVEWAGISEGVSKVITFVLGILLEGILLYVTASSPSSKKVKLMRTVGSAVAWLLDIPPGEDAVPWSSICVALMVWDMFNHWVKQKKLLIQLEEKAEQIRTIKPERTSDRQMNKLYKELDVLAKAAAA